jgi:hypothetical protein
MVGECARFVVFIKGFSGSLMGSENSPNIFAWTSSPSPNWIIQQLREATPFGQHPGYLFRDNDRIYRSKVKAFLDSRGKRLRPCSLWFQTGNLTLGRVTPHSSRPADGVACLH